MAECSGSQLTVDWFGFKTVVVSMSDWTNGKDQNENSVSDRKKRSGIVHAIIHNRNLVHLSSILGSGWDINEILVYRKEKPPSRQTLTECTALGEAARAGWTDGVKMLLDAGAKCITSNVLINPITMALLDVDRPADLIELLLQHGADPNNHDLFHDLPLLHAIINCRHNQNIRIVQLLLEHGADPNLGTKCPLLAALQGHSFDMSAALLRKLVTHGANINIRSRRSLLHSLMLHIPTNRVFLPGQLDLFFLHGGNINMEDGGCVTVLEHVVRRQGNSNNIRWLIRHGADISAIKVTLLKSHCIPRCHDDIFPETPLILLQAGMRVSHGVVRQLSNMQTAISAWLQDNSTGCEVINEESEAMWAQLKEAEDEERPRMQNNPVKSTFPEYWTRQMVDLQEFSDENLNVYTEIVSTKIRDRSEKVLSSFEILHTMLEFLRQPQSLRWNCRRCVRENLVSLQPSVVKALPGPAMLKRYILCHEI